MLHCPQMSRWRPNQPNSSLLHKQSLACPLLRNNLMSLHECFHHPRSSLPIAHHLSGKVTSHPITKGMTHKSARRCIHFKVLAHEDFDSPHSEQDYSHNDLTSALIASATSAASIFARRLLKHHPDYCSRHQPEGDDQTVISGQTQRRKKNRVSQREPTLRSSTKA